jgi:hypothetical protein
MILTSNSYNIDRGVQICTTGKCINLYVCKFVQSEFEVTKLCDLDRGVQICTRRGWQCIILHFELQDYFIWKWLWSCMPLAADIDIVLKMGTLTRPERHWKYEIQEIGENSGMLLRNVWFGWLISTSYQPPPKKKITEGFRTAVWLSFECSNEIYRTKKTSFSSLFVHACAYMYACIS